MEVELGSDVVDEVESTEPVCNHRLEHNWFAKNAGIELGVAEGVHVAGALAGF